MKKQRISITVNQIPCWKLTDERGNCVEVFRTKQAAMAMKSSYQKTYMVILKIESIGIPRMNVGRRRKVVTE